MTISTNDSSARPTSAAGSLLGILPTLCLMGWLLFSILLSLVEQWRADARLSHSPLLVAIAVGLFWMHRVELKKVNTPSPIALPLLVIMTLLYVAAVWADIVFLRPFAFLGMVTGAVGYLAGRTALNVVAGALGLLVFTLPWPSSLIETISFPLQLTSSAYAALFSGLLGFPIHREGVHLSVMSVSEDKPIYSILVASQCSGLTSIIVLLALGYLIAYFTPTRWWGRLALVAAVIPLALLANALRLTTILIAGAQHGAALAQWVHDHEQPVLIFICSLGLLGLRQALLIWTKPSSPENEAISLSDEDRAQPASVGSGGLVQGKVEFDAAA
jgi:exosortase